MKHEKTWYTCDRCGAEIDRLPDNFRWTRKFNASTGAEIKLIYEDLSSYLANRYPISPKTLNVEIIESTNRRSKEFHLCPECRKDFERFMRNEENTQ